VQNGCARGSHGNTIFWPDSVIYATQDARANLAANLLGVEIKEVTRDTLLGFDEVALQQVEGVLEGIVTVAVWLDRKGVLGGENFAYALVCKREVARERFPVPEGVPQWVYDPTREGRLCVWGFSAATIDSITEPCSERQRKFAIENTKKDLSKAIAVSHKAAFLFYLDRLTTAPSEEEIEWAKQRAENAEVVEEWCDRDGRGPLQDKIVYYCLMCL
jgi:hypothetical protein